MERRVSRVRPASEPPGVARSDLEIIATIGNRVAPGLFEERVTPEGVFAEFASLTAGTTADHSGIDYERLEDDLAVRWPAPDADTQGGYRYLTADGWSFDTDSGRARFSTGSDSRIAEPVDDAYPLTLTTGRLPDVYNTGVRSATADDGLPTARMHSKTIASQLSAFDRGRTAVQSRRGRVTVRVDVDDGVPVGVIWLPIHQASVNELTLSAVDPESDEPNLKQCAVGLSAPAQRTPSPRPTRTPVESR